MSRKPRVAFSMGDEVWAEAFTAPTLARLDGFADVLDTRPLTEFASDRARAVLAHTDILFTGWGVPALGPDVIAAAPSLQAVIHAAGTVRLFLDPAVFSLGVRVSTCASANAVPVAEFALAATIFGLKRTSRQQDRLRLTHASRDLSGLPPIGMYRVVVGIVGASRVGREYLRLLRGFDVRVLLFDPYVTEEEAARLGVELVTLDDLCRRSDVVSIHAPLTESTRGMIGAAELATMRDGTVVINTARGAIIDTVALTSELVSGRLDAYLDVVDPEPMPPSSPLYSLPNVTLTPHIAGALGNEVARLGELAVTEAEDFITTGMLNHEVLIADFATIA